MQARTGVSGRMVPGAALASTVESHSQAAGGNGGGKKKKKGGRKHRKKAKAVTTVAVEEENKETEGDEPSLEAEVDDTATEKTVVSSKAASHSCRHL